AGATQVVNQGTVSSDDTAPELTDADGNDANGNQATVTPVGTAPALTLVKGVEDLSSGVVKVGDELLYTLQLTNSGTKAVSGISIVDAIPAGTTYVAGSTTWTGVGDPFVAGGAGMKGSLHMSGLSVDAGATLTITYRVKI